MKMHGQSVRFVLVVAVAAVLSPLGWSQAKFHHLDGGIINGVFFFDSQRGWTAEDGGRMQITTDVGQTWSPVSLEDEFDEETWVELRGVFVRDLDHGWCVGDGGVVLVIVPGTFGQTWRYANESDRVTDMRDLPLPCGQNLASLYNIFMLPDNLSGFACGLDGALERTFDGGTTWIPAANPPIGCSDDPEDFYDIHFFADSSPLAPYSVGILTSEHGVIWRTVDFGNTWSLLDLDASATLCPQILSHHNLELWAVDFVNPLLSTSPGWLVGGRNTSNGYAFYTEAFRTGGAFGAWSQTKCYDFLDPAGQGMPICGLSTLYAVAALSATSPMAVTGGYEANVFDWRPSTADFDPCACTATAPTYCTPGSPMWVQWLAPAVSCAEKPPIFGAARISDLVACLVGSFGRILLVVNGILSDKATTVFTRLADAAFTSATTGVVTGQGWAIKRTTDAGLTWNDVDINWLCSQTTKGLGIAMSSAGNKGVMVGTGGFIAYGTNSGQTWTRVQSPPPPVTADLNAVEFTQVTVGGCAAQETAFAVSSQGEVVVSHDFGQSWSLVSDPDPGTDALYGVSFATSCVGYVCGLNAKVFRTTDGGQTWAAVPVVGSTPGDLFYDVTTWGDGTQAIMVGQNGGVYEKSGTRFVKQTLPFNPSVTALLRDVEILNSGTNVRICGDYGVVLFRDSGTWTKVRSQTTWPLVKLDFQSPTHGFGVGFNFMITEYRP